MTVGRDYMLAKPDRPSLPKEFIDTRVIPLAVNITGEVEVMVNRAAVRLRVRPSAIVAGIAGLACLGLVGVVRGRSRGRRPGPRGR